MSMPSLQVSEVRSLDAFKSMLASWPSRELPLPPAGQSEWLVSGFCAVSGQPASFRMDDCYAAHTDAGVQYNWRERLVCSCCGLNARQRACIHLLESVSESRTAKRVWITEQLSPVFRILQRRIPTLVGSEFLGPEVASGSLSGEGVRHEDVTSSSFTDACLDAVLSFDVLEHVPDPRKALRECARVLAPGGVLLFTVPFLSLDERTRVRARIEGGQLIHLMEPQYHGDPVLPDKGVLCFHEFGWDILEMLKEAGFADACALVFESMELAYLGGPHIVLKAVKAGERRPGRISERVGLKLEHAIESPDGSTDREAYKRLIAEFGATDTDYLSAHFDRFVVTKRILESTLNRQAERVLDIGAHWLHQSVLYALDGYQVTAADFPVTLEEASVKELALAYSIQLVPYRDLERPTAFADLPDDSFDIILFTEILEHLTFNPVAMWRELYRLLAPQGRIVVTTPNYYRLRGRAWAPRRLVGLRGGGISVPEVLATPTYGHHWKEYSLREVSEYFERLSPDFVVAKALHVENYYPASSQAARRWISSALDRHLPILRQNLHVEVSLARKARGISLVPSW